MTRFERAFQILVGHEGGYVNHPADPGGETKFGISKRSYSNVDIANLTLDEARRIYLRDYWSPICGDMMPAPVALVLFDAAVNNGVEAAIRCLQRALGVPADGRLGPQTLGAVQRASALPLAEATHDERVKLMTTLPRWDTFGAGWARRLARLPWQAAQFS